MTKTKVRNDLEIEIHDSQKRLEVEFSFMTFGIEGEKEIKVKKTIRHGFNLKRALTRAKSDLNKKADYNIVELKDVYVDNTQDWFSPMSDITHVIVHKDAQWK